MNLTKPSACDPMPVRTVDTSIVWVLLFLVVAMARPARPATAQTAATSSYIRGVVVDAEGAPMPYVNVFLVGTMEGAATDADGRFAFTTRRMGQAALQASMIGYEPARRTMQLAPGDTIAVRLVLRIELVTLGDEVVVEASAYTTGEGEQVALRSLEAITTPGANADILLAVKAFPGVASVDEGAGLFVRGGDKSETSILLDGATVTHPYKYESPTGGVFGIIPPFLVRGTIFSTGGFSARYGNALSGVLAMESLDLPAEHEVVAGVGLAAASVGVHLPLVPERLGVRVTGNRSFTGLLFRINDRRADFTVTPRGSDGNVSLVYRYRPTGQLKLFHFRTADRLGVLVSEPSFEGVYRGETATQLYNLHWRDLFGSWLLKASASRNHYAARQQLGNLDLRPADTAHKLRFDAERRLGERATLALGGEMEYTVSRFRGRVPAQAHVLHPDADVDVLDERYAATRTEAYAEGEWKVTRRLYTRLGTRVDAHTRARRMVADPRVALRYVLSEHTDLRLAWGRYHQFADPLQYNPENGNPDLGPQRAQHLIAGVHHERELLLFRLEAYLKTYRALVVATGAHHPEGGHYANIGDGYARGVDLFAKYGAFLRTRISGWVAYSLLKAQRLQPRNVGTAVRHARGPAPYDVTHTLNVVGKVRLVGFLNVGLAYRYATGRPVTPVVGAEPQAGGSYFLPVEGLVGSERLPAFQRLDAQLSYYVPFGQGHDVVFYAAVNNALGRTNVLDYEYNADYSARTERTSYYRRFIYVGATLTLH